jgi:hypothetical protein
MSQEWKNGELHVEIPVQVGAGTSAGTDNRRRHDRLEVGLSAHCQIDGVVSQEALGDLSMGGLYLRTSTNVRIGARVRVVLGLPYFGSQRVCSLNGTIVWIDRNREGAALGAGVEFDHETSETDQQLLAGFLTLWGTPGPRFNPGGA